MIQGKLRRIESGLIHSTAAVILSNSAFMCSQTISFTPCALKSLSTSTDVSVRFSPSQVTEYTPLPSLPSLPSAIPTSPLTTPLALPTRGSYLPLVARTQSIAPSAFLYKFVSTEPRKLCTKLTLGTRSAGTSHASQSRGEDG
ncbi:hypothetical protein HBI24_184120 [Parastagonospora nodorum]|nr:hypothetical protein HBH53_154580 [Parastagonospora nodorum]KAH4016281.1 hypothetical protein HBI13_155860 [Parastagonospora nodorum]KAH4083540.1 hypothetical protein HBH48_176720 [Parastagonospora nodorum]KAH4117244.1 hypothetical protein HBH47_157830 [Parastagonospora nodorum]KAH4203036.1 hypothetical protein HBI95_161630 [Parastagonospora nodorum]